jgi:class 3 adenylate cyclase
LHDSRREEMTKKKPKGSEIAKKGDREPSAVKVTYDPHSIRLSEDAQVNLGIISKVPGDRYEGGVVRLPPASYGFTVPYPPPLGGSVILSSGPGVILASSKEQELEDEIAVLRSKNRELQEDISAKIRTQQSMGQTIQELNKNIEELSEKQRLRYLLDKVNGSARTKLLQSEDFRNLFEKSESCIAVIMAVDIRRSTELMLKARAPQLYADFITNLCGELTKIILDHYGVFDKFTGDGILAFFPEFYSGGDSTYWALRAACECHKRFSEHYRRNRNCFTSVLVDVGLGIGIDYGESHLVKIQDGLTVIGTPVVYACRLSGAKAGQTLLNQPAYEVTSRKFGQYVNFREVEIDMKNEGLMLAYIATLTEPHYKPQKPDWDESIALDK